MKNERRTIKKNPRGSALLISLLLMAFLMVFGFGISQIVVDSIRVERNVVDAGMAYFSAEGAVESALYYRENRLPGYEAQDDSTVDTQDVVLENGALMTYNMMAAETLVPCAHEENAWRELGIQESVSWPLYRWDAEVGRADLKDFTLSFKVEDRDGNPNAVSGNVLRWKILGIDKKDGNTKAISGLFEYTGDTKTLDARVNTASFYEGSEGGTYVHYNNYPISDFLHNHYFNTLILTNVIVLSAQDPFDPLPEDYGLQLQLSTNNQGVSESPCEYTLIQADGRSGGVTQNIDVKVKLESFLPVFNFVLYETAN
ncbi:MAG: hypothetical protein WCW30_00540 [Candidatus Gracilibacteria bacterium]